MVLVIASLGNGMCPKAQVGRVVEEEGKPRRLRGLLHGLSLVLFPLCPALQRLWSLFCLIACSVRLGFWDSELLCWSAGRASDRRCSWQRYPFYHVDCGGKLRSQERVSFALGVVLGSNPGHAVWQMYNLNEPPTVNGTEGLSFRVVARCTKGIWMCGVQQTFNAWLLSLLHNTFQTAN